MDFNYLYKSSLAIRNRHFFILDCLFFIISPFIALFIRLDGNVDINEYKVGLIITTLLLLILKIAIFYYQGIYNRYWHYASVDELARLIIIVSITVLAEVILFLILTNIHGFALYGYPKMVSIIDGMLTLIFVGGTRLSLRVVERISERRTSKKNKTRVLIIGAGKAGIAMLEEMQRHPKLGFYPIGFIDDDPNKLNMRMRGLQILGNRRSIAAVIKEYKINMVIIAIPSASGEEMREIVEICNKIGVKTRTIPGIFEILGNTVKIESIREVNIEDLLRRAPVKIDIEKVANYIKGKCVLITGAGGSIGSELCRQIIDCGPSTIILFGHGENSLFDIDNQIKKRLKFNEQSRQKVKLKTLVADIKNKDRLDQIFDQYKPNVVFHAAAHKHVPIMENNPVEAVLNNVLGTKNLINISSKHDVEHFVMISTDKAVNPTSIMGATKRVAEMLVLKSALRLNRHYVAVRFGNVLGSRGSVVLTFKKQISEGGPITITHPDIKRFFMTIPEAVQLVLQTSVLGNGGEVFVLDMGEAIKISDLAKDIVKLSGLQLEKDIKIQYTGLRKGEKLFEELFVAGENYEKTEHSKILKASNASSFIIEDFDNQIEYLIKSASKNDLKSLINILQLLIPEYLPSEFVTIYSTDLLLAQNS